MGVVMRFSGGTAEVLPTPAPCFTFQPPSSSMSSTGRRPWRMCSWRTAGRTPRSCGRSSAAPRESLATIQVGASPSPQSTQRPTPSTSPHLILGVWEGMVTLSIQGDLAHCFKACYLGQALPCQYPPRTQSSPFLPQLRHGEPPRKSTCTMSAGDPCERAWRGWAGTLPQLAHPPPSLPVSRPPSRAQPALSNFHFTHRCHWKMDPITQAGLPAASALIHCPALHPLGTEGLGPWGFPRGMCPLQGWPAPAVPLRSPGHPTPSPPLLLYSMASSLPPVQPPSQL